MIAGKMATCLAQVGYLPDGTPMNMAGNCINHPETIGPDPHTPGAEEDHIFIPPVYLSIYQSIYSLAIELSVHLSIYVSTYLPAHLLATYPSIYPCIHLFTLEMQECSVSTFSLIT